MGRTAHVEEGFVNKRCVPTVLRIWCAPCCSLSLSETFLGHVLSHLSSQIMLRVKGCNILMGAAVVSTIMITGLYPDIRHSDSEDWSVLRYIFMSNFLVTLYTFVTKAIFLHQMALLDDAGFSLRPLFEPSQPSNAQQLTASTRRLDRWCR
jgi:hypothetical protein